jgi:hypothetical protein
MRVGTLIATNHYRRLDPMRSDTSGNKATIAFDDRDTSETPKVVSGATWATVALLVLIVILGALFIGGFFASLTGSGGLNGTHQTQSGARP